MPNEIKDLSTVDKDSFDYIFEQNVSIVLKSSSGIVRCNVYRPKSKNGEKVPVLMTYGPYGKDISYQEYAKSLRTGTSSNAVAAFMLNHSQKSIQNTSQSIRPGRHPTLSTGLNMATRLSVSMNAVLGSHPVFLTRCREERVKHSLTLWSGLLINLGRAARLDCWESAIMREVSGALLHCSLAGFRPSFLW
jgi:hypothetical protein